MQFKVGDKVDYIGNFKPLLGLRGVVIRRCPMLSVCTVVKMSDGSEKHMRTKRLKLKSQKNQQLLFDFMQQS